MRGTKQNILDVGFGIGWGLDQMVEADVIEKYVGFEPNFEAFNHVRKKYKGKTGIKLRRETFFGCGEQFRHVFCIEVIDHVAKELHPEFVGALREACEGTLWLSTPDASVERRGVVSREEMIDNLKTHFSRVTVHDEQWTTLYIAQ